MKPWNRKQNTEFEHEPGIQHDILEVRMVVAQAGPSDVPYHPGKKEHGERAEKKQQPSGKRGAKIGSENVAVQEVGDEADQDEHRKSQEHDAPYFTNDDRFPLRCFFGAFFSILCHRANPFPRYRGQTALFSPFQRVQHPPAE